MYVQSKKTVKNEIKDQDILGKCAIKISDWVRRLNLEDTVNWSVKEVINFINQGNSKIQFIPFCNSFISKMINENRERTAQNYQTSLNLYSLQ